MTEILWLKICDWNLVTETLWLEFCDWNLVTEILWMKVCYWNFVAEFCDWHFVTEGQHFSFLQFFSSFKPNKRPVPKARTYSESQFKDNTVRKYVDYSAPCEMTGLLSLLERWQNRMLSFVKKCIYHHESPRFFPQNESFFQDP